MTSEEIAASVADLARMGQLMADNARLIQALDAALSIVNGWSIDTQEVGFCTLAEDMRPRITEAREIRAMDHPGVGLLARMQAAESRAHDLANELFVARGERVEAEERAERAEREREVNFETILRAQADAAAYRAALSQFLLAIDDDAPQDDYDRARGNAEACLRDRDVGAALLSQIAECQQANTDIATLNMAYLTALDAAYRALMSYAHGNAAPGLAAEVANHILKTIVKAGKL